MNQPITQSLGKSLKQAGFFSRSVFYSPAFLLASSLFLVVVLFAAYILYKNWDQLTSPMLLLIFMVVWGGAIGSLGRAIRQHATIHELFLVGKIDQIEEDSPLDVALSVAERSLKDGLFYLFTTIIMLLFVLMHCVGVNSLLRR
jgi:hypothetical protein